MKILICGAGSIGKRHIANSLNLKLDVLVWRKRINYRNDLKKFKNLKIFNDLDTAINLSDCVIVATSTVDHDLIISKVIKFKKPLYIEKPISNNLRIINKLKKYNKKNVIHNGFQFRYHQNLIFFKKKINNKFLKNIYYYNFNMGYRLSKWRSGDDYTKSYSSKKNKGGGVILDLIHQIDIAIWFFGSIEKIKCIKNKRSDLKIDVEDIAHIIIKHCNGLTGVINLDMVSPVYTCDFKIVTKNFLYTWNYNEGKILRINENSNKIINKTKSYFKRNDMFKNNLKEFIKKIKNKESRKSSGTTLQESIESLKLAIKCKKYI